MAGYNPIIHGHASKTGSGRSLTYKTWRAIMQRCHSPNYPCFNLYGGRGIFVCERWHNFVNFLADMGERKNVKETIDRIDNSKGYEPGNCRWTSMTTQVRNRSITRVLSHNGQTRPVAEWAELTGINYKCLSGRISRGWPVERALNTPVPPKVSPQSQQR